jgi:hypothetical protein
MKIVTNYTTTLMIFVRQMLCSWYQRQGKRRSECVTKTILSFVVKHYCYKTNATGQLGCYDNDNGGGDGDEDSNNSDRQYAVM